MRSAKTPTGLPVLWLQLSRRSPDHGRWNRVVHNSNVPTRSEFGRSRPNTSPY